MDCTSALSVTVRQLRKPPDLVYPTTFNFSSWIPLIHAPLWILRSKAEPFLSSFTIINIVLSFLFLLYSILFLSALQLVFLSFCILSLSTHQQKNPSSSYPCMTYTIKTKLNKLLEKKIDMLHWGISDEN